MKTKAQEHNTLTPTRGEQLEIYELLDLKMLAMRRCLFATSDEVDARLDGYRRKFEVAPFSLLSWRQKWRLSWKMYRGAVVVGASNQSVVGWFVDTARARIKEASRD